ncbi:MAG: branched-chain amino acid transaminase [Mycobacterium sp.]
MKLTPTDTIWMDGKFVPWDQAHVHVLTPSLHYGWGVYEGIRAYATPDGPAVFRLRDHLKRLHNSARVYMMDPGWTVDELTEASLELLRRTGLESGYLRPIVYLGYGAMGVAPALESARVAIAAWPLGSYLGEKADQEGCRLVVSSWQRNGIHAVPPLAKATGAYVNSALAKTAAVRAGYDDALMLTPTGHVSEASAANIFAVRDGELITPPISDNILAGVTRDTVITLARDLGFTVKEQSLTRSELYVADEAFLTGTAAEIVPVASVDDRPTTAAGCGPITKQLRDAFNDVVRGRNSAYRHWLEYVGPSEPVAAPKTDSMAVLEDGVARLADAALFDDHGPAAVARREETADRAVDLIAARAWHALPGSSHGLAKIAAERCVGYVVASDADLVGRHDAPSDRFALTADALVALTHAEHFDAVVDRSRELLGTTPEGRLSMAWQIVDDGLNTLNTTRHEWVGADPATVAAAGWVLIDRMGRLLIAAALVAEAARGGPVATTVLLVNAARRYAWNHLRRPAPEAATATHVQRSAGLVRAVLPWDVS